MRKPWGFIGLISVILLNTVYYNKNLSVAVGWRPLNDYYVRNLLDKRSDTLEVNLSNKDILISAQGGGIYSAFHTALSLAQLQDRCRRFSEVIRGISGVSGGALGLAVFIAAVDAVSSDATSRHTAGSVDEVRSEHCDPTDFQLMGSQRRGPHERLVRAFFESDFSSPVVAGLFYSDLPSLIMPFGSFWPEGGRIDRARALEIALATSWLDACRAVLRLGCSTDNFFERSIYNYTRTTKLPILLTTSVVTETGNSLIFGSVSEQFSSNVGKTVFSQFALKEFNFSVATAVVASARFPYVLPAGVVNPSPESAQLVFGTDSISIVDGGYFENSGSYALLQAFDKLIVRQKGSTNNDLFAVQFTNYYNHLYDGDSFRQILAPLRAALNAGAVDGGRHWAQLQGDCGGCGVEIGLLDRTFNAPLAWYISRATKDVIAERTGLPAKRKLIMGAKKSTVVLHGRTFARFQR